MELEPRVKALEYEMKILKNEIQRTLLDIQEQVLIHYYPSLRTEVTDPTQGTLQAIEIVRAKQAASSLPAAKKVSLDEVRASSDAGAAATSASGMSDRAAMAKLSEWAGACAVKIGGPHTIKIIEVARDHALLARDTFNVLLRLVALHKDAGPDKVAINDVLALVLKLNECLGHTATVEEALAWIEEAKLG